jgi:hypothetical protein
MEYVIFLWSSTTVGAGTKPKLSGKPKLITFHFVIYWWKTTTERVITSAAASLSMAKRPDGVEAASKGPLDEVVKYLSYTFEIIFFSWDHQIQNT